VQRRAGVEWKFIVLIFDLSPHLDVEYLTPKYFSNLEERSLK